MLMFSWNNNTDYLYDKRIYEITNDSYKKEKKLNDKKWIVIIKESKEYFE